MNSAGHPCRPAADHSSRKKLVKERIAGKDAALTPESDFNILHNVLPTIGIWHMQATSQNTIAENHYGPIATNDPSSLSRSASCANFKRPANFKDCGNYYPLHRSMSTFWNAQILDCWRLEFGFTTHEEMLKYFETMENLPEFDYFMDKATRITSRWVSLESISQALCPGNVESIPMEIQFPVGDPFPLYHNLSQEQNTETLKDFFQEHENFTGDRVLANSILFKWEYSLWLELAYAVPEGDIGRVWEIMKILIFIFAGGGNTNYRDLLLEMYCLFCYESSKDLKDAIWNNWLVNVTGELGKWIPDDLLQEHYNRWLEELLKKSNGSFDDSFLRKVLSPNVEFFLRLKEEFETSVGLHHRSKSHTSPHLRAEYQQLLTMYQEEKLHIFRKGRSMGHSATDLFDKGVLQLRTGALKNFLDKQTDYVETLKDMDQLRKPASLPSSSSNSSVSTHEFSLPMSPPLSSHFESNSNSDSNFDFDFDKNSDSDSDSINHAMDGLNGHHDDEETDLLMLKQSSTRLLPGLELMPTIDPNSGRLLSEWTSEEELEMLYNEEMGKEDSDGEVEKGLSDVEEYWETSDNEKG
ncbi:hypothetical protein K435DRAFT_865755 [Dendrothele bispora CBS 962.96]|uniref:DUF6589 domain-containing protein n=1 Tax=Dendrothele bispora (strain CBS 962.96) TaxID=1314807 RepID=A0A4S8LII9_DENBC|nr:hypothetical protein K435DRAFT_865755 [Dendrothele bispora CBS 962.96]